MGKRSVNMLVPDKLDQRNLNIGQLKAMNRTLQQMLNDAEGRHLGGLGKIEGLELKLAATEKELAHVKALLSGEILDLRQKLNQVVKIFEATCAIVKTY